MIQILEQNQVAILDEEEKEADVLLKEEAEEVKIDLLTKKEIIRTDSMRTEMQKMVDFIVLKKSLMERKKVLKKGIDIRNQIESVWIDKDKEYKKIILSIHDYNIFTKYNESTGMLPPHRDWPNKLKYPLLQFNLILSQEQIDFNSGEFVFEDYNKKKIKIHKDLKMKIGDALLFDKYLLHSVDLTEKGITDIGRWSVLIGARAHKINYFQEKKNLFLEKIKNFIKF